MSSSTLEISPSPVLVTLAPFGTSLLPSERFRVDACRRVERLPERGLCRSRQLLDWS